MMKPELNAADLPLFKRLDVRLGLLLFISVTLLEIAMFPVWTQLYYWRAPELGDPEYLRLLADQIEASPSGDWSETGQDFDSLDTRDNLILLAITSMVSAVFGAILAIVVSWWISRRIRNLARQTQTLPDDGDSPPGPFQVKGEDEVGVLAMAMNAMRGQIVDLLDSLRQRDKLRREWVAQVSHDLRTPLAAMRVTVDRCAGVIENGADQSMQLKEASDLLMAAQLDVERMEVLTEDLLEISRLEEGIPLKAEPILMEELVCRVVRQLTPLATHEGVAISTSFQPDLPSMLGDGRRLIRVVENLVRNSIAAAQSSLEIQGSLVDGRVMLCFQDDGPGFPGLKGRTDLSSWIEQRAQQGTHGFGLKIANGVVQAHHGRVEIESNDGAKISIYLPLSDGDSFSK